MENFKEIDRFVKEKALTLLKTLDSNAKPLWGIMSPIHMVENLAYGFDMSVHNFMVKKVDKEVEQNKTFVKENGFPISKRKRNASDLKPIVNENLNDAIIELDALILEFYDVLGKMNDSFKTSHFYFGLLNFNEWRVLHFRHLQHHLQQFELIPLPNEKFEWQWPHS